MKTKIALGSWNYIFGPYADRPISLEEALKKLSSSGYDGVELCGFKPHVHPDLYPTKEIREKLKSLLAKNSLGTSGFAPDFMAVPPASAPAADYKKAYGQALALAKDLGMPKLRVDTVSEPDTVEGAERKEVLKKIADVWRECARMSADAGVVMTWEFEPGFLFNRENIGIAFQICIPAQDQIERRRGQRGRRRGDGGGSRECRRFCRARCHRSRRLE